MTKWKEMSQHVLSTSSSWITVVSVVEAPLGLHLLVSGLHGAAGVVVGRVEVLRLAHQRPEQSQQAESSWMRPEAHRGDE
jgi:hypothetical protein